MSGAIRDLTQAARSLRRRPAFSITAVACVALGVCANAVMFGLVDRLFFRPPAHVVDPGSVVRVYFRQTFPGVGEVTTPLTSFPDYWDLQTGTQRLIATAAYHTAKFAIERGPRSRQVNGALVTASFFSLVGARPALGRFISSDDIGVGRDPNVAVLSEGLWRAHYGADPSVLGRRIRIGDAIVSIIGVAPSGLSTGDVGRPELWLPLDALAPRLIGLNWSQSRGSKWLQILGRVGPGETPSSVQRELAQIYRTSRANDGDEDTRPTAIVGSILPERGPTQSSGARVALWLAVLSVLVLLIACANLASLQLIRGVQRVREVALLRAVGATRMQVARRIIIEAMLLAVIGGVGGLVVMASGGGAMKVFILPGADESSTLADLRVLAYSAVATLLIGIAAGLIPALLATTVDPGRMLRGDITRTGRGRLRYVFLVGQVALTMFLLAGAALFTKSLRNVRRLDLGLNARDVLVASFDMDENTLNRSDVDALYGRALERVNRLNGVEATAVAVALPFWSSMGAWVRVPGLATLPKLKTGSPYYNAVTPGYFRTLGMRLIQGRAFTAADEKGAPRAAIVNETMARLLWPGQTPIGKCMFFGRERDPCAEIVGVVADARRRTVLAEDPTMQFYVPLAQDNFPFLQRSLFVRVDGVVPHARATQSVRGELNALDRDMPYVRLQWLEEIIEPQIHPWRLGAIALTVFGAIALVLAMIGLYGVTTFAAVQRTREIGVRLALGSPGTSVVRLVVGDAFVGVTLGIGLGIALIVAAAPVLGPLLFNVSPTSVSILWVTGAQVALVTLLATAAPVLRALRVPPSDALRTE